jgi:L-aspartate oxidase
VKADVLVIGRRIVGLVFSPKIARALLAADAASPNMSVYEDHALSSLAPRDIVARETNQEMKQSGPSYVLLDCTGISPSEVRSRFPKILKETVTQTTLPALFAAGETACAGVHRANRLVFNSLREGVVFAHRAVARVHEEPCRPTVSIPPEPGPIPSETSWAGTSIPAREEVRDLMWRDVGIVRNDADLAAADARLNNLVASSGDAGRAQDAIVRYAHARVESRALHFNQDHLQRNNERFLRDTVVAQ